MNDLFDSPSYKRSRVAYHKALLDKVSRGRNLPPVASRPMPMRTAARARTTAIPP